MNLLIEQFKSVYQELNESNIESIESIYDKNIVFIDPFQEIHGLDQLIKYFNKLYQNVAYCRFNFEQQFVNERSAALFWSMEFAHKSLKNGEQIKMDGCTLIQCSDKVIYHRDYFDAGAMVYENIPLFGHAVKYIKGQL